MTGAAVAEEKIIKTEFDINLAKAILRPASFWEHPDYPYCILTLVNEQNGTKLIIGIGYNTDISLNIDLVAIDCPPLNEGNYKPHQRLAGLSFSEIERVVYCQSWAYVEFTLRSFPLHNDRWIRIFDRGFFIGPV